MFNKKAADPKNKPDEILKILELQSGQTVADIGSGGGYFSIRFAETVGNSGRVLALDTNPKFLEIVINNAKRKGLTNIEAVLTAENKLRLPEKSIDLFFMRNVCHHLPNRVDYFKHLQNALKPNGRIAVVEYKETKGLSFHKLFRHFVAKEEIIQEMKQAGFKLDKDLDFLQEQSFTIYRL
jgi:arsenite methyltransferase